MIRADLEKLNNSFCGFLWLENPRESNSFSRKFFRLDNTTKNLLYYSENLFDHTLVFEGGFDLTFLSMTGNGDSYRPKVINCFYLVISGVKHFLKAESEKEKEDWMKELKQVASIEVPMETLNNTSNANQGFKVELVAGVVLKTQLNNNTNNINTNKNNPIVKDDSLTVFYNTKSIKDTHSSEDLRRANKDDRNNCYRPLTSIELSGYGDGVVCNSDVSRNNLVITGRTCNYNNLNVDNYDNITTASTTTTTTTTDPRGNTLRNSTNANFPSNKTLTNNELTYKKDNNINNLNKKNDNELNNNINNISNNWVKTGVKIGPTCCLNVCTDSISSCQNNNNNNIIAIKNNNKIDLSLVLKSGYLVKQGYHVKTWKTRFFKLTLNSLSYFKSHVECSSIRDICVKNIISVRHSFGIHLNRNHLFEVVTKERVFYCQAKTEEEKDGWIREIEKCLLSTNGSTIPCSCDHMHVFSSNKRDINENKNQKDKATNAPSIRLDETSVQRNASYI